MAEVLNHLIEKLEAWQLLLVILTGFILFGAIIFFVLVNRVHIKFWGLIEVNARDDG